MGQRRAEFWGASDLWVILKFEFFLVFDFLPAGSLHNFYQDYHQEKSTNNDCFRFVLRVIFFESEGIKKHILTENHQNSVVHFSVPEVSKITFSEGLTSKISGIFHFMHFYNVLSYDFQKQVAKKIKNNFCKS